MAFLGGIGKALGLSGEFGKGLVGGLSSSLAEGFDDDMKRTKDNVDNLVLESYKGGRTEKLRFDKEYKENEELIKQIAGNVGGADGVKHPQAYDAAQALIAKNGSVAGAYEESVMLKKGYDNYSRHPIESMNLIKNGDRGALTASMLANNVTTQMSFPDMAELGKSANVGIMKSNFLGPAYDASGEIENRSNALLQASGVDINKKVLDIPEALLYKVDPLVAGIQDNPTAELLRLQRIISENDKLGNNKDLSLEANAIGMIDSLEASIKSLKKGEYLDGKTFITKSGQYKARIAEAYGLTTTSDGFKSFKDVTGTKEQLTVATRASLYYAQAYNFAMKNGDPNGDTNQYEVLITEAIINNQKIIMSNDNGVFIFKKDTADDGKFLSVKDLTALTKGVVDPLKDKKSMPGTLAEVSEKIEFSIKSDKNAGKNNKDVWLRLWRKENPIKDGETGELYYVRGAQEFMKFMRNLG